MFEYDEISEYVERLKNYMLLVGFDIEYNSVKPDLILRYPYIIVTNGNRVDGYYYNKINFIDDKTKRVN